MGGAMSGKLPASLISAFVAGLVLAVLIGCCSAYSSIGVAAFIAMDADDSVHSPELEDFEEQTRMLMRVQAAQVGLLLLTALALGVGCGVGLSGRPIGRLLALGAFALLALGAFSDIGFAVWAQLSVRESLGLASAEETQMFTVITAVSLVPSALWMLLRLAVAGAGAAAMFSPSARDYYAHVRAGGVRGPRD